MTKLKLSKQQMLFLYTAFLFLLAVSVAIMPIGSAMADKFKVWIYISGTAFWLGSIGTIIMICIINYCRKKDTAFNELYPNLKQLGLINFLKNKYACVADVAVIVSMLGFIITKIYMFELFIPFIFLAMTIFFFGMHCMLNGINYVYIKHKKE